MSLSTTARLSLLPDCSDSQVPKFENTLRALKDKKDDEAVVMGQYAYFKSDVWLYVDNDDYRNKKRGCASTGCKLHINIANPAQQMAQAWDIVLPIFLKYPNYFFEGKVLRVEMLETETVRRNQNLEAQREQYKAFEFDDVEGVINAKDNPDLMATIEESHKILARFKKGSNIIFYLDYQGEWNLDRHAAIYKKIADEIDQALTKAGLTPGGVCRYDFPVKG